ncbi:MAG: hypothetical protein L6Q33_05310 [Bacteriovoracaceae bacterium]|nr:hypothetical protein [Bacteriovoracaceae bacterium]
MKLKFIQQTLRSSKEFNFFFILCFSLGILGLILVESFKAGVEDRVSKRAKNFIASDLSISSRRQFTEVEKKNIEEVIKKNNLEYSEWIETYSLVSSVEKAKLADLNFVAAKFPFYGGVIFENGEKSNTADWETLSKSPVLWLSRDLSWELKVKVGDQLKIGESTFQVGKVFTEDQFSSFRGFNLAPKIFLSKNYLAETKLMQFGSTGSFAYLLKINDQNETLVRENFSKIIKDQTIKIKGPKESSEQIARSLNYLSDYLGLITLLTYILSLIGLYYFTHHFLSKGLKSIALFKALGFTPQKVFILNAAHLIILSLISLVVSFAAMLIMVPVLESLLLARIGEEFKLLFTSGVVLKVSLYSVIGCLLSLLPLILGAVKIPVNTVLQDIPQELKRLAFWYYLPLFFYVVLMAVIISHSIKIGIVFISALLILVGLGYLFFKTFSVLLEKSAKNKKLEIKHGFLALSRYFHSSFTIFMSLLLGVTLIVLIIQVEASLRNEFTSTTELRRPDLFMFDLQDNQEEAFKKLLNEQKLNVTMFSPMIRGRLTAINNGAIEQKKSDQEETFVTREEENQERFRTRGVNLSYRGKLSWSESITKGKFFSGRCDGEKIPCEISLEESYARRMNVNIGDKLTFDVSGIDIVGVVTSFRKVKWTSFEPNFFILFQPGLLEEAPKTFLASFKVKSIEERREIFQLISNNFANVSLLEVSEVVRKITEIFELMAFSIKIISFLSLAVALVVVWAVSFNHLELKIKEMKLFFLMGMTAEKRETIYKIESFLLTSMSIGLAIFSGTLITFLVLSFGFNITLEIRALYLISFLIILFIILNALLLFKIRNLVKRSEKALITF